MRYNKNHIKHNDHVHNLNWKYEALNVCDC